jgi:hypothetical protein
MQTSGKHLMIIDITMTSNSGRKSLEQRYGMEIVVLCCREWKTHYGDGKFGRCGICHKQPKLILGKKWDE